MRKLMIVVFLAGVLIAGLWMTGRAERGDRLMGINVLIKDGITPQILTDLKRFGKVKDVIRQIHAVTMLVRSTALSAVRALPYVEAANPDEERAGIPIDTVAVEDFSAGWSTWNLDAINVTDFGYDNRQVDQDGTGVYVAVLDTGLIDTWRQYFPQERIAAEYARSFGGGGLSGSGEISEQPNKWEHDTNSHGTHVTSTILGYNFYGTPINGVAPMATVIPVKVLNQTGWGWSSVIARGIVYVADLKMGPLSAQPVIINMSLGGGALDAVEKAAIDYAVAQGVIVVAAAGNSGPRGMDYPGAYSPVISVANYGWEFEWSAANWWRSLNVGEPTNPDNIYIDPTSGRAKSGQDLDVAAPGSWIVGPYQLQQGQISYYYLGGTSMATPHVAGIVALMAQKYPALTASEAEGILESTAIDLPPGCLTTFIGEYFCWGADATGAGLVDAAAALAITP